MRKDKNMQSLFDKNVSKLCSFVVKKVKCGIIALSRLTAVSKSGRRLICLRELVIMKFIISGKNLTVTEGLRTAVTEKIGKLEKYFTEDTEIHVTLSTQKERQKIEVTIPMKGNIVRAEQESNDMYVSIDLVEEIIERQLRKYKTKIIEKQQAAVNLSKSFIEEDYDDEEIKIFRTKRFAVKPMDAEEACVQMELLGHNFFVFRNAETDEVNVVYKRKENTYGLIEPEC